MWVANEIPESDAYDLAVAHDRITKPWTFETIRRRRRYPDGGELRNAE